MKYALDSNGNRICADVAEKGHDFFCDVCKNDVVLYKGQIISPHFEHKPGGCSDSWNYEMSDWHWNFQAMFPEDCRERTLTYDDVTHRADILQDNMVIEFQHSKMSIGEFDDRTDFFLRNGYSLSWVVDVSDPLKSGRLKLVYEDGKLIGYWTRPMHMFDHVTNRMLDSHDFALWFSDENCDMFRVGRILSDSGTSVLKFEVMNAWIRKKDSEFFDTKVFFNHEIHYDIPSFVYVKNYVSVSCDDSFIDCLSLCTEHEIVYHDGIYDVVHGFTGKVVDSGYLDVESAKLGFQFFVDRGIRVARDYSRRFHESLRAFVKKVWYNLKVSGSAGYARDRYVCPLLGGFGIVPNKCEHCKFCADMVVKKNGTKYVHCTWPKPCRFVDYFPPMSDEYEVGIAPIIYD